MTRIAHLRRDYAEPTEDQSNIARESSRQLAPVMNCDIRVHIAETGEDIVLPAPAVRLLVETLVELGKGSAVSVVTIPAELTTQQAANILNVSRPYVVKLLEEGKLPYRKVGSHRRILLRDLLAYKREDDKKRMEALKELVALSQEMGLYDE